MNFSVTISISSGKIPSTSLFKEVLIDMRHNVLLLIRVNLKNQFYTNICYLINDDSTSTNKEYVEIYNLLLIDHIFLSKK